ncbi:hypothetical protein TNCV_2597081 [Trichonephila clavipes]|nr:hypothetical protein TNCV_2597081 [Trichonephila clavipes]
MGNLLLSNKRNLNQPFWFISPNYYPHIQWVTSHVVIVGNEKADFLPRTEAEEEVNTTAYLTFSVLSPLHRLNSIISEELLLVILGTSEEIQEVHSSLCVENTRLPSGAL